MNTIMSKLLAKQKLKI